MQLCYETFGDPGDPAMLLIMGLGTQMIGWHEDFCRALVERGFFVIRYDNRDSGRSTHFESRAAAHAVGSCCSRRIRRPAYTLTDMANDAAGLLDALEIEAAHVVGASMGGMIAQTLAARHPERVLLAHVDHVQHRQPRVGPGVRCACGPTSCAARRRAGRRSSERIVTVFHVIGSPGFANDDAWLREMAELSFDRGADAASTARQLGAIIASGNRTVDLRRITAPTLVDPRDGRPPRQRRRADAPPPARSPAPACCLIEGMGHDLPRGAWPRIIDAIVENAARAKQRDTARAA